MRVFASVLHAGAIAAIPVEFEDEDEEADLEDEMVVIDMDLPESEEEVNVSDSATTAAMAALRSVASASTEVRFENNVPVWQCYSHFYALLHRLRRKNETRKSRLTLIRIWQRKESVLRPSNSSISLRL